MRFKFFVFVSLFLALFSSAFAFEVYDSQGDIETYFSLSTDDIKIESDSNTTDVRIDYMVLGTNLSRTFEFESCADKYCVYTTLGNLILWYDDATLANLEQYNITVGTQKKTIYLDIEKPVFDYIDYSINSKDYNIKFNYSYSDNSNKIKKVELYSKSGDDLKFVADLKDKDEYVFDIEDSDNFIFNFRIYDEAGNLRLVEKIISVGDIFAPVIQDIYIELKNSNYLLSFNLTDDNLSKYEISQGGLILSEDISGSKYLKTISLPFSSGNVLFKVVDEDGNSVNTTLSLKSSISNSYEDKFSNEKEFKFSSNADECYLTKIDSKNYNEAFSKSSSKFSKALSISRVQEYNVGFYCEKNNFREYFSRTFYYDTNKPTKTNVFVSANDAGGVDISWNESYDDEGDVKYKLFRDEDLIYEGSKEIFEDNKAVYPNSYTYYVKAYDQAGNSVDSEGLSITPKKVLVTFLSDLTNTKVDFSSYNFEINTDLNSDVKIIVKNSGTVIKEEIFENITSSKLNLNYELQNGENVISVLIVDELGNRLNKDFSVVYREPILQQKPEEPVVVEPVIEQVEVNTTQEVVEDPNSKEGFFSWFWFILILVLFGIFIKYFILDEDKLSFIKRRNSKKKSSKNRNSSAYNHKRSKDYTLEKDFNRIKKERIRKQQERLEEIQRQKKFEDMGKKRSDLSQRKMDDLASRKEVFIPFTKRVQQKQSTDKIRNEKEYDKAALDEKRQVAIKERKERSSWFKKNEAKEEYKDDEFSRYIQRVKEAPSWGTTRDYVYKEPTPEPKAEEVKPEEYEKSLDNKKSMQDDKLEENKDKRFFSIFRRSRPILKEETKSLREPAPVSQKEVVKDLKEEPAQKVERVKVDLDDYLNKRIKNKRRNLFFVEKSVDRDLRDREN